ncbi:unnamed protein product [Parascedosporium putredinis]|uniref:Fatty acid hydroxylase domain-containing protein n=1 Tax=Parascedosporium putredinis TaxID=1442378 RepID=A0A9P1GV80_9PEZI|nr:unnamed protein product [Parascedosporium putredinis]CAI7987644.1 unnamed protein product [Parascedosporium putredinis]
MDTFVLKYNVQLNMAERLWASWYVWMQNDTLATGILSFVMHEVVYFGRALPWIIIGMIPYFDKWKIQNTKTPTLWEQAHCAGVVLLSHFTVELPQIWFFHPVAHFFGMDFSVPFPALEDDFPNLTLHYGPLYKAIHKLHHYYSAPFGLTAEYASPIETMILGLGTIAPPALWVYFTNDFHLFTMRILPFWAGADHHDLHHEKFIGNYASSFRWWDKILDTEATLEARRRRRDKKLAALHAKKAQ